MAEVEEGKLSDQENELEFFSIPVDMESDRYSLQLVEFNYSYIFTSLPQFRMQLSRRFWQKPH